MAKKGETIKTAGRSKSVNSTKKTAAKSPAPKKPKAKSLSGKTSAAALQNSNWKIVECPKCSRRKFDFLDQSGTEWKLKCKHKSCSHEWVQEMDSRKAKKNTLLKKNIAPATTVPKRKKQAHVTRPTDAERLEIELRRNRIINFRIMGASERKIQQLLKKEGIEVSLGTIHRDLAAIFDVIGENTLDSGTHYRYLTNERCEEIIFANYQDAKSRKALPDVKEKAVRNIDRMIGRQIQMGIIREAPKEIVVNPLEELAKLLGCTVEELPDDLKASSE